MKSKKKTSVVVSACLLTGCSISLQTRIAEDQSVDDIPECPKKVNKKTTYTFVADNGDIFKFSSKNDYLCVARSKK